MIVLLFSIISNVISVSSVKCQVTRFSENLKMFPKISQKIWKIVKRLVFSKEKPFYFCINMSIFVKSVRSVFCNSGAASDLPICICPKLPGCQLKCLIPYLQFNAHLQFIPYFESIPYFQFISYLQFIFGRLPSCQPKCLIPYLKLAIYFLPTPPKTHLRSRPTVQ